MPVDVRKVNRNKALLADLAAGMTQRAAAAKYGITYGRVHQILYLERGLTDGNHRRLPGTIPAKEHAPHETRLSAKVVRVAPPPLVSEASLRAAIEERSTPRRLVVEDVGARQVIWRPQPGPQTELLRCPVFEVLYGGARGGGKTDAMIGEFAQHAQLYGSGANGRFFRRERVQLMEAVDRAKQLYMPFGVNWHEANKTFSFPNGARLVFSYLESDGDAEAYQGHAYTRIYLEELGNFPNEKPVAKLRATLRSAHGVPCRMRATANPGGPGHHWVYRRYIGPAPGGWVRLVEDNLDRVYIPAKVSDNQALIGNDPGYVDRLRASGSAALVRAWLDGDWDAVEGAYFDGWDPRRHIVRPVKLPEWWVRFMSFDWGSARPFSVGWYAVSDGELSQFPKGAVIRYREWYGASGPNMGLKLDSRKIAEGILAREAANEKVIYRVADPACFKAEDGPSIAEKMANAQVRFEPADHSRIAGWEQVRLRLEGEEGWPMLYVFDTCPDLIRTLPALQHDQRRPEDIDTDGEDHAADELRYGLMSRPYWRAAPVKKRQLKDAYRWDEEENLRTTGWAQ